MNKLRFLFLLGSLLLPLASAGQAMQPDSTGKKAHKLKPYLSFDSRNSFVLSRRANFLGIKTGITDGRMRWGIGFYYMTTELTTWFPVKQNGMVVDTVPARFHLWYGTYFLEPVIVMKPRFELSLPVNIGLGSAGFRVEEPPVGERPHPDKIVPVLEPYLTAQYKVLPWLGLGAGGGYRFTFTPYRQVRQGLNAPIYFFKVKFFAGVVLKAIRKKKAARKAAP